MPVVAARDASAVGIRFLMACRALKARHAVAIRTSHDVRDMTTPCVALLRILHCRVAIDAARMNENGTNLLPGGESLSSGGSTGLPLLARAGENTHTHCEQEQSKSDGRAIARHIQPPGYFSSSFEHGVGSSGLRVERERCRQPQVGLDVRLQVGDLLLGGTDRVGPGEEAARRRLLPRDGEERLRELRRVT